MGLAGKQPLGIAFFWWIDSRDSQLLQACQARLDAKATRDTASGYCRPLRSRDACAGRFSVSNRIDSALYRDVSGCLLGKQLMERQVRRETSEFRARAHN